jgi:rfaE bifunctional protein kinase chain/domain
MTPDRLSQILSAFPTVSLAVVGDYFLDQYLIIEQALSEVSLETGLEAYQVVGKRPSPGAAGTVTNNLVALEVGEVHAVGFTGDDGEGYELRQRLAANGVEMTHLLTRPDLFTPTYTKPMLRDESGAERELNRLDIKNREATPAGLEDAILAQLEAVLPRVQAVIIADQIAERHLGVITDRVREGLAALAAANPRVHFLADSRAAIGLFRNVMVKPNKFEAARAAGYQGAESALSAEDALAYGSRLAERNDRTVFVTAGAEGLFVMEGELVTHVPGCPVPPPVDIVGAGDSTTAGIVLALCAGATPVEAAAVGNCVASLTIQQLGTTGTASRARVAERFAANANRFAALPDHPSE